MLKIYNLFKKILFSQGREDFYYLKEEIEFENRAEHHKVSYLSSYKNVG